MHELTVPPAFDPHIQGESEPAATASPPAIGRSALLAAVPVTILAVRGWQQRWMADDALIGVRIADQLLHGHGLVYNAGERVETSTSPLWIVILAVARIPRLFGLEAAAVGIGLISTVVGLILACWGATLLWRRDGSRPAVLVPAGAVVLAVLPPMWDYATSGLETGLSFLWLGGCFRALVGLADPSPRRRSRAGPAAFLVGLGPLVRPDFAVFSAAFLVAILVLEGRAGTAAGTRRRVAALLAVALAAPATYQVLRMGYYGSLVPNTAVAKEASQAWWSQGLRYLGDLFGTYWLLLPLTAAGVLLAGGARDWARDGARRRLLVAAAAIGGGAAHGFFVVRAGGDFMHGRMLLPALFAVLLPVAVVEVRGLVRWATVAAVLAWAVVCGTQLRIPYGLRDSHGIADERRFYSLAAQNRNPIQVDDYRGFLLHDDGREAQRLGRSQVHTVAWRASAGRPLVFSGVPVRPGLPFDTAFITANLGIVGVVAGRDVQIIDPSGLSDPFASRVRMPARGRPGHEKRLDLVWILARFADPTAPVDSTLESYGAPVPVPPATLAAARHALRCGPFRDIDAAATEPLTPARFVRNIGLAIRLRHFRFDPDPAVAEARVCRN